MRPVATIAFVLLLLAAPSTPWALPYNTPSVDGRILVNDDDWDGDDLAAENADLPSVSVGDLTDLWVTWDAESLYIGIRGPALVTAAGTGRLAFALDTYLGSGTGRSDFRDKHLVGPAVAMRWVILASGFGADYVGMARATDADLQVFETPETGFANPVSSYNGALGRGAGDSLKVIEVALPWTLLYPGAGGGVTPGAEIGVTAVLLVNQASPPQQATDDVLPSRTEQGPGYAYDEAARSLTTDTVVEIVIDGNGDGVPDSKKGDGVIAGTLAFDDNAAPPFPSAEVSAYLLGGGPTPFRTEASDPADGSFRLTELTPAAAYRVTVAHPWYEPLQIDSLYVPAGNPTVDIGTLTLTAYTGSISGNVLPRTVVARVVAYRDGSPIDSTTVDGSTGAFQVRHLETGTYDLAVRPLTPCYVAFTRQGILVVNGEATTTEDITLSAFGSISGTIAPATELVLLEAVWEDSVYSQVQTTGSYRLPCLPEGTYTLRVTPDNPEYADAQADSVHVVNGQETGGVDFTLLGVSTWRFSADPVGDDHGPCQLTNPAGRLVLIDWNGNYVYADRSAVPGSLIASLQPVDGLYYTYPTSLAFPAGSHDIRSFEVKDRETSLEFVVTVGALPDPANPEPYDYASWVGFLEEDAKILLQSISIYIDAGPGGSIRGLPWRAHDIAEWDAWEYAISMSGWWKGVIHSNDSSLRENYTVYKTDLDIDLEANFDTRTISAKVPKRLLGNPTEEEFSKWDILLVLSGHDAGDTDLNLGAIRWVEGGFSPEWRFQGGRSGGEGTWDGKQDPNVVDILPLPGAGHAYPDSLTGEMMDYTRPQNRIRIETDEYPVRLSASRFEDREAPDVDFSRYFAFSAGTETAPDWTLDRYGEILSVYDADSVAAYGAGDAAILTDAAGSSFEKALWVDRSGWYDVRVRSIAGGQRMRLECSPGASLLPGAIDTLEVQLPATVRWAERVWGTQFLQQGYNFFRFQLVSGIGDISDGMTLIPTVPEGEPPLNLQIARLANCDRLTLRTGVVDNMGFRDYLDAWVIFRTADGDTQRVTLGQEEGTDEWLADIDVGDLDELVFHFEAKDRAGALNPEPKIDNWAAYPRIRPDRPITPSVRDSLLALPGADSSLFFYRIPIVEIPRFEATERGWLPRRKTFRSPEGSKVIVRQSDVPEGVAGLKMSVAAVAPDSIQSLSYATDRGGLRSIGVARDLRMADLGGNPIETFTAPVEVSLHYPLKSELEGHVDENRLVLYRWEPQTSRWVFVGGRVNPAARTVLFQTQGLAGRYAVFEDRSLERNRDDFITGISFTPNPFSPNGDGIYDMLRVSYYLWRNATITIDIYDMSGREVNNFVFEETGSPGEALGHEWDGRDKNGEVVPYGVYIVRFRAVDESEFLYRFNKAVAVIR